MLPEREDIANLVVCDDDEVTLDMLCDHLAADRFGVMPAPSASDALRLCRYNHPDLLLLDLSLPDASGLDVLREIREADGVGSRFDPRLPVIILTGRSSDHDRVRGLDSGADDYIVKPSCSLSGTPRPRLRRMGWKASPRPLTSSGRGTGTTLRSAAPNGSEPPSRKPASAALRT